MPKWLQKWSQYCQLLVSFTVGFRTYFVVAFWTLCGSILTPFDLWKLSCRLDESTIFTKSSSREELRFGARFGQLFAAILTYLGVFLAYFSVSFSASFFRPFFGSFGHPAGVIKSPLG